MRRQDQWRGNQLTCILEFDGASRGNHGPAGAGAILRDADGGMVYRLREGVGFTTNDVAEYRALILGMKQAIQKGYKHIRVQGDSEFVCNEIQGLWTINNQNLFYLCNEAWELKKKFQSFSINHVPREYKTEADVQANLAINLQDGQVEEDRQLICILEFDGASRGNRGPAGAGAILRDANGGMVYRLREGVGFTTNDVAEYRALILGMKQAIQKGYKHIRVQGDSELVCNQIQGLWTINNQNLFYLCNEVGELKIKFQSFSIYHVPREYNTEADVQANLAIKLRDGQVEEDRQLLY